MNESQLPRMIEQPDSKELIPVVDPQLIAQSPAVCVPTAHGHFKMIAWQFADGSEHLSLQAVGAEGNPRTVSGEKNDAGTFGPAVRIHSECATGDIFGSYRCDCGAQLAQGLRIIQKRGGYLIYARQHEGRGIGLVNKLRAYSLQSEGLDTVDANLAQGLAADQRDYRQTAVILRALELDTIQLISNNPAKQQALTELGITVTGLISDEIKPRPENHTYLETKRERMNHLLTPSHYQKDTP